MVNENSILYQYSYLAHARLDAFVSNSELGYSRSFVQKLIKQGAVSVNGTVVDKPGYILKQGDIVEFRKPPVVPLVGKPVHGDHGVKVLFAHEDFIIVDKPAGLIVHPPNGYYAEVTLVDCLIDLFPTIQEVGQVDRPGIVHRLDRDTSGLMVIPLNNYSLTIFGDKFKDRKIQKQYLAVVHGSSPQEGVIDKPIGRDPITKVKMAAGHATIGARSALTYFTTLHTAQDRSTVLCKPVTGRTHQIRVHMASIKHPLVGDILYGGQQNLIQRQALHAYKLSFDYAGQGYEFAAELPEDMSKLINYPVA